MKGFTPLGRLLTLEKLATGLWEIVKKMEVETMGLKERITALEDQLKPKVIPYGRIYDTLREIDLFTGGPLPGEEEQWEADFIRQNGTREDFINERTRIREV